MQRIALIIWVTLVALLLVSCKEDEVSIQEPTPVATEAPTGANPQSEDDLVIPTPLTPEPQPTITVEDQDGGGATQEPADGADEPQNMVTTVPGNTPTPPNQAGEPTCLPREDWPLYTVRRGETLGEIAVRSDISTSQLAAANCLIDPNRLYTGQLLRVPENPEASPSPVPTEVWTSFYSARYQAGFNYPAAWRPVGDGSRERFEGEDGWLEVNALSSPWSLGEVVSSKADDEALPFGSAPTIERFTLIDGRQARIIAPSADQSPSMKGYSLLIAPYALEAWIDGMRLNYLTLAADIEHVRSIAATLEMIPPPNEIGVIFFTVDVVDLADRGKRLTFNWDSYGATRGVIYSGTAERFAPWWPVEAGGELTVDLDGTLFPDPKMVLRVMNEVSQAESTFTVEIEWPCAHDYFFEPAPDRCPRADPLVVTGAYQPFERGFMIWLPAPDWTYPAIYVLQNDGWVRFISDEWLAGQPEEEPALDVPDGFVQPVRGFGKVWLGEPGLRETLGWATAPEYNYEVTYQGEARESLPGVVYLRDPAGRVLRIVGFNWSVLEAGE